MSPPALVLFHGTHEISVNRRTRARHQEKRTVREKARVGVRTFAWTADVSEAHRQAPIERDWHPLGCQVAPGGDAHVNTVEPCGVGFVLLVSRGLSSPHTWPVLVGMVVDIAHLACAAVQGPHAPVDKSIHVLPERRRRCNVFHRVEKEVTPPPQVGTRRHPPTWRAG